MVLYLISNIHALFGKKSQKTITRNLFGILTHIAAKTRKNKKNLLITQEVINKK